MQIEPEALHREIVKEIAGTLGFTEKNVPTQINEGQASIGAIVNFGCQTAFKNDQVTASNFDQG